MVLIPINRSTIRRNPTSGRDTYDLCTGPSEVTEVRVYRDLEKWYCDTLVGFKTDGLRLFDGILLDRLQSESKERPADWVDSLNVRHNIQRLRTLTPEPRFLYEYEDTEIMCQECGARFPHHGLVCDEMWDAFCDTVCPECGAWDCCKIEYEKLTSEELEACVDGR